MSTCFLKRFVPFLLTLVVGVGLGSLFQHAGPRGAYTTRHCNARTSEHNKIVYRTETALQSAHDYSVPLDIIYQPPIRMTEAALRHQTSGVVQLLVEYGANGHARVLKRIETLPDGLTEEAVRVAEETHFRPEWVDGVPVSVTRMQSYYFSPGRD